MSDAQVVFDTSLDDSGLKRGFDRLKSSVGGLGAGLGAALGTAGIAMAGAIVSSMGAIVDNAISTASRLQEVQNVVDVTFGESAAAINEWAKSAKDAYGMGELKAKQYTSTIGAMFKSMGMADAATLEMSKGIGGLTGDMASFYNLDYDTAFDKLRAGISGETEPLKQLGINMSVANLEAYALSQGIATSYQKMTQAQQVTLRYNYLMQVTADAQGDFARTSDGYANQQRILATTQEELAAVLGEILLPIAVEVTKALTTLTSGIGDAIKWVGDLLNPPKSTLDTQISDAQKAVDDFNGSVESAGKNLDSSLASAKATQATALSLLGNYDKIASKNVLTEQDTAQLQTIAKQIVALYPDMGAVIDSTTGLFDTNTTAVKGNITALGNQQLAMAYYAATQEYQTALLKATVVQQQAFNAYDAGYKDWLDKDRQAQAATGLRDSITANWDSLTDFAGALISLDPTFNDFFEVTADGKYALTSYAKSVDYSSKIIDKLDNNIAILSGTASAASASTYKLKESWDSTKESTQAATEDMGIATESLTALGDAFVPPTDAADTMADSNGALTGSLTDTANGAKVETDAMKKLREELQKLNEDTLKQIDSQINGFEKIKKVRPKSAKQSVSDLNSQKKYLEDYAKNLKLAEEKGLSPEALQALSDGSADSAARLAGLATATTSQVAEINALYATIKTKKTELTSQITGQSGIATTTAAAQTVVDGVTQVVTDNEAAIKQTGTDIADKMADGVDDGTALKTSLYDKVDTATTSETAKLHYKLDGYMVGMNVVSGVVAGINAHGYKINVALAAALSGALLAVLKLLGIKSPSTVFRDQVGAQMAAGIEVGFVGAMAQATKAIAQSSGASALASVGAINNTLLGQALNVSGLTSVVPTAGRVSAMALQGSTLSGLYGSSNAGNSVATVDARQYVTFEYPMQAPDEVARAIRRQNTYGLAGGRV